MSHLKIESARRQLGTALALFLVAAVLAFAAPAHAQQQSNVDQKMCYGGIPQETMHEIVRKSVAKVGGPQLERPVDELIYMMLRHEVETLMGPKVDSYGRNVKPSSPLRAPAFTMTDDLKQGARAMTACFSEVQEAVAKQQDLIRESKRPVNQLFMAYKLYSHVQFCRQRCPRPDHARQCRSRPYSALMLAALMNGHHFSISALWKAPNASGVCWSRGGISAPKSATRCRTAGSARASATAPLSLAMTGLGVALGTHIPNQKVTCIPGTPISSIVGISGAAYQRALSKTT
jgi:hypothetical protein